MYGWGCRKTAEQPRVRRTMGGRPSKWGEMTGVPMTSLAERERGETRRETEAEAETETERGRASEGEIRKWSMLIRHTCSKSGYFDKSCSSVSNEVQWRDTCDEGVLCGTRSIALAGHFCPGLAAVGSPCAMVSLASDSAESAPAPCSSAVSSGSRLVSCSQSRCPADPASNSATASENEKLPSPSTSTFMANQVDVK
jgi:hypothetical protein